MSMRFKSLKDLGSGAWKVAEGQYVPNEKPSSKKPSSHISLEKLETDGPQAKLTELIKKSEKLKKFSFEENKSDAIPNRRFEIDIAFTAEKLAVEVDGWQYHGKYKSGFHRDRIKQNLLVCEGWRVLRFTAKQIYNTPSDCEDMIYRCLKSK